VVAPRASATTTTTIVDIRFMTSCHCQGCGEP
jgi:hypothetical protein